MGRNTLIAIACAIIAGMLVIIAGRSCADNEKTPTKTKNTAEGVTTARKEYQIVYNTESNEREFLGYDLLGNPIYAEPSSEEAEFDEFGNPVTTAPSEPVTTVSAKPELDLFGNPVTTAPTEPETTENTAAPTSEGDEEQETTTTLPPGFSGFDHGGGGNGGESGEGEKVKPTLPPDYKITIR